MLVSFHHGNIVRPALEITDKSNQVVIRFLPYKDEHITIHLQPDGSLLRTHHTMNKPKSVWSEERVQIVRGLGYKDPERHGQYISHTPLTKLQNLEGYHLVGRFIDLVRYQPKQKYTKKSDLVIPVHSFKFMLGLFLSTKDNPRKSKYRIVTSLGEICCEIE